MDLRNIYIKRLFPVLCLVAITGQADGQARLVDSLEILLSRHSQEDTVKLNILNDLAYYCSSEDPDKGLLTADKAIALAKKLHNDSKLSTAYNNKGINYNTKGNDSLAIVNYTISMDIKRRIGDPKGVGVTLHNIGIIYSNRADYRNALDYQERAYEIFKSIGFEKGMASTLNSTGIVYLYLSDYLKSLDYYLRALSIYEQSHDEYNMANTFTNIGLVYDHSSQFGKALEYYSRAEKIFKKKERQYELQNVLTNIGNTYDNARQPSKALEYYTEAKQINEALGNKRGAASGLVNSAIVYIDLKNHQNALKNLEEALHIYNDLGDKYGKAVTLSYLSKNIMEAPPEVLKSYGTDAPGRYNKALALQQEGLHLAIATGLLKVQSDAWEHLSTIYQAMHNDTKALAAFKEHIALRDSIMNDDKKLELSRLAMQYDFDKKETAAKAAEDKKQQIAKNALEKQKIIRNVTATAAIIIIFAAGISFIFYDRKRKATSRAREAELKAEMSAVEMKALRAQMNPHFIFNSLNSISDCIRRNEVVAADRYLTKFSRLIRTILEFSEHREIPLEEDLMALDAYLQLESLRMNHRFTYTIKVDTAIDQAITLIPPLILQPFVENSLWHGLAGKDKDGEIKVEIRLENEMILCSIEDNGTGMQNADPLKKGSLGMKITRTRIDLLNRLKNANASFELVKIPVGTRVELRLPVILSF